MFEHRISANKRAIKGICMLFGALILIGGIVYSEILFLGIISNLFPSGPMAIGAMLGAVTTGASILVLVLAKSHWFRPGSQLMVAWIFTGIEAVVLIFNDMLAYQIHQGGQLDQYMATWKLFCVAAPVLSVVGWILCFYFDPQRAIDHHRMEMEDNHAKAQIDFEDKMHLQVLNAKYKAAGMVGSKLEEKIETQLNYHLEKAAAKFAAKVASDFIGEPVSHVELMGGQAPKQLPSGNGKVVDANPPVQQAASRTHTVDPHGVKDEVEGKKKKLPLISFKLPDGVEGKENKEPETIESPTEEESIEQETIETQEQEPEWKPGDELPENYLEWSDDQWKQAKDQIDAFTYQKIFDHAFPDQAIEEEPKKRGKGGKQRKNVTRREVLGMENQAD